MLSKLKYRFVNGSFYQRLKKTAQNRYLSDKTTSFYILYKVIIRKAQRNELMARADGVAFNLTLSVFPFLIFLFTLIPYIPIQHLDRQIMEFLGEILPAGIYKEAAPTISDIVSRPRGKLLSLGVILALYGGTAGMMALMTAFNKMYRTIENRGFIQTRLTAIGLTLILVLVMIVGIALIIVGQFILDWFVDQHWINDSWTYYLIMVLRYGMVLAVFLVGVSAIYYIAPAIHKRWQFISAGSIIASLLIILATQGFSYYISHFASYNRLYGSLGTFIAMMVWFLLVSIILLLGFEINASLDEAKIEAQLQLTKSSRDAHKIIPAGRDMKKSL
jgi:membrane protein